MSQNPLILTENNSGIRIGGVFMFGFSLCLVITTFLTDLPNLFGYNDLFARIIFSAIALVLGIAFGFASYLMITTRDKRMIFDSAQRKMFYTNRDFFQRDYREHSFTEIVNFGQTHTSTENNDYYENYLHLSNATGIEIPSNHKTDKDLQDQQTQTIKDFIGMK